jgi:RNA polymerase sigma-70 factor (ECF subfamily)
VRLSEALSSEAKKTSPITTSDRADVAAAREDDRIRVRAALARLTEDQREAINLAFFGGFTQSQIAEKLGAPLGTVKARIRRGLLALRDALRQSAT